MPSYKTHSLHGEVILPEIMMFTKIKEEYFKTFCMGPDVLIFTDLNTFSYQHVHKVKDFFENIIYFIKQNHLEDNPEVMAFLYGQIDHFVLDFTMHPLIIYLTEGLPKDNRLSPHGIVEMWFDDYLMKKFQKDYDYYHIWRIEDKDLKKLISEVYQSVYQKKFMGTKYSLGIRLIMLFDIIIRQDCFKLMGLIEKVGNLGDIRYHEDYEKALPYLNLDHQTLFNPETEEIFTESFMDLWETASNRSLEIITDVNRNIYFGKSLSNHWILDDTSYNTGLPCSNGQKLLSIKKYR